MPSQSQSRSLSLSQSPEDDFTRVNGVGMWNSWTRNFKTPLLAMLDLLDNSFDASLCSDDDAFVGRVRVAPLTLPGRLERSGVVITNNSARPIKDLSRVLEVYSSAKGKNKESVGENGVGLKQGCATLSDTSLVIRKHGDELELGVVARSLQRNEGVRLPSFSLTHDPEDFDLVRLRDDLSRVCDADEGVGGCVAELGGGSLDAGLEELRKQFHSLLSNVWGENAFCVIISDLLHGTKDKANAATRTNTDKAAALLEELKAQLPKYYIHVPPSFLFHVGKERVRFDYWQKRLVELSFFQLQVDRRHKWCDYSKEEEEKWKNPSQSDQVYSVKMYLGFDPLRIQNRNDVSALSAYIYSRQSGRLINYVKDARARVRLTNSGTSYAQGLTLLVDDRDGRLPLNPTKQDVAFGEEEFGGAHEENLHAWMSAVTQLYWNYHAEKTNLKKRELGQKILACTDDVQRAMGTDDRDTTMLADMTLTEFKNVSWTKTYNACTNSHHIRLEKKRQNSTRYTVLPGKDTLFRIEDAPPSVAKTPRSSSKKRAPVPDDVLSNLPVATTADNAADADADADAGPYPKRSRTRTERYSPTTRFHLPHVVAGRGYEEFDDDDAFGGQDDKIAYTPSRRTSSGNGPSAATPSTSERVDVPSADDDRDVVDAVDVSAPPPHSDGTLRRRVAELEKELQTQYTQRLEREKEFQEVLASVTNSYEQKLFGARKEARHFERLLKAAAAAASTNSPAAPHHI